MRGVRLTVEVGPAADVEPVLDVEVDDLAEAVHLHPVPLQWTWTVEGVEMRLTASRSDDTPGEVGS